MMNPLEHFIYIAQCNLQLLDSDFFTKNYSYISNQISENMLSYIPNNIKLDCDNTVGYKSIELAGIAKFFEAIEKDESQKVVYENTLGMTLHGIDAITKDNNDDYTIYEIKGTTRNLRSPKSYLKKTRNRGRQLTWEWCWASLVDMAEFPLASSVFLELYEHMINQKIKRKLVIVECRKEKEYYLGHTMHIYSFDELNIREDYQMIKQKEMLLSLKRGKSDEPK